ncbi:MAG: membrane protein insertase YidC [Streptosporangiaceae bacterium]
MGILNPFYDAVAWVLMRIHAILSVPFGYNSGWSWALSIIFLVVLMRLILVPLFVKQMHAQRKMAALAPQVAALRKKYKNDKQTMNQEVMKLYQENGANPLAGCLPLVVQLPVFFALFNVLRAIAEGKTIYGLTPAVVYSARHADILSATIADRIVTSPLPPYHLAPGPLSAKIVIGITVLISATTTFLTVRQSVKRGIGQVGQDPNNPMANSQKYMMYIAPLFALSGLYWQFGLVLYWVTTNVWTLGQQFILFRNFTPITAAADAESATAPAAKGTPGPAGTTVSKGAAAKSPARGSGPKTGSAPKTPAGKAAATKSAPASKSTPARTSAAKSAAAAKNSGSRDTAAAPPAAGASAKSTAGTTAKGTSENPVPVAAVKSTGKGGDSQGPRSAQPHVTTAPTHAQAAAKNSDSAPNGTERRGLAKLVRGKSEPEPEPEVPAARLVRQQPVRQSRSKRSGKR